LACSTDMQKLQSSVGGVSGLWL